MGVPAPHYSDGARPVPRSGRRGSRGFRTEADRLAHDGPRQTNSGHEVRENAPYDVNSRIIRSTVRRQSAAIVRLGLAVPKVGNAPLPTMKRLR